MRFFGLSSFGGWKEGSDHFVINKSTRRSNKKAFSRERERERERLAFVDLRLELDLPLAHCLALIQPKNSVNSTK